MVEGGGTILWLPRWSHTRPRRLRLELLGQDASVRFGTGPRNRGLRSLELLAVLAMSSRFVLQPACVSFLFLGLTLSLLVEGPRRQALPCEVSSFGRHLQPSSLYLAQLADRQRR